MKAIEMTKSQEIEALDKFIQSLPRYSYLRPWLESVRPQVVNEITSDFAVSPSIQETRRQCEALLKEARGQAAMIVSSAQKDADRERSKMGEYRDASREAIIRSIEAAKTAVMQPWTVRAA